MDEFDVFLKSLLQAVFRDYPYDEDVSKRSFKVISDRIISEGTEMDSG